MCIRDRINKTNEKYRENGLALIQKIPTPITPIKMEPVSYTHLINILAGLNAADKETLAFYRSMGMNDRQLFRMIRLPLALPHFFSGLRISAVYSVMGAVIGEWLGAQAGLGLLLIRAQNAFNLPLVFAAILAIIIWSALIFAVVKLAESRCLKWRKYLTEDRCV